MKDGGQNGEKPRLRKTKGEDGTRRRTNRQQAGKRSRTERGDEKRMKKEYQRRRRRRRRRWKRVVRHDEAWETKRKSEGREEREGKMKEYGGRGGKEKRRKVRECERNRANKEIVEIWQNSVSLLANARQEHAREWGKLMGGSCCDNATCSGDYSRLCLCGWADSQ